MNVKTIMKKSLFKVFIQSLNEKVEVISKTDNKNHK